MKEIPLSRGLVALVDDEDYPELPKVKWWADNNGYAIRSFRNPDRPRRKITLKMHRVIMGLETGDERHIDHRDRNVSNNQKSNLRIATPSQNQYNHGAYSNNSSGFKGVYWNKLHRVWYARIGHLGKRVYLGTFHTAESAYEAYCKAAKELHGEFANFG